MTHVRVQENDINTFETNRTLADPLRVSIIEVLQQSPMTMVELSEVFNLDERLMRYHLQRLVRSGVVSERWLGKYAQYAVTNEAAASACHVLYQLWAEQVVGRNAAGTMTL